MRTIGVDRYCYRTVLVPIANETSQWRWLCRQFPLFDLDHCPMNEPSWLFPWGVQTIFFLSSGATVEKASVGQ